MVNILNLDTATIRNALYDFYTEYKKDPVTITFEHDPTICSDILYVHVVQGEYSWTDVITWDDENEAFIIENRTYDEDK